MWKRTVVIAFVFLIVLKLIRRLFRSKYNLHWADHVFPHGPIEKIAEGLYRVEGKLPHGPLPRNMVIYQLEQGGLLIHSPIVLNEDGMKELEALGKPRYCIVPNSHHRLDGGVYKVRYPEMMLLCPAACRLAVQEKYKVDGVVEDYLKLDGVVVHFPPNGGRELVYELTYRDGSGHKALVCADLWFNLPHQPGVGGKILRAIGSTGTFGVTGIGRLFTTLFCARATTAAFMRTLAVRPGLAAIIPAHGTPVMGDCREALLRAAARLTA